MSLFLRHIVLPAIAPAAIVGLYFTPVLLFGCVNQHPTRAARVGTPPRGLMAVGVALVSAAAAFVMIGKGIRARARDRPSAWWLISTLILTLPLVLLLGPLG
jgi:hypothetical protein